MSELHIDIAGDVSRFAPGDVVSGEATWRLGVEPKAIELRLVWRTQGRGSTDEGVVQSMRLESPGLSGEDPFAFTMPDGPLSFSGRLISLAWFVEGVSHQPDITASTPIDLVLGDEPINITATRKLHAEGAG